MGGVDGWLGVPRLMAVRVLDPGTPGVPRRMVTVDSTPIDVLVLLDSGVPVRADLTIVVDVATRISAGQCCARWAPRRSTPHC